MPKLLDLRIGDLDEIVTLMNSIIAKDEYGGNTETWSDTASFRAAVVPMQGTEQTKDALEVSQQYYKVVSRCRADVTPNSRILWRGTAYQVVAVTNEKRRGITTIEMRLIAKI